MSTSRVYSRGDHSYLGNDSSKEVHRLSDEDTSANGCQIDELLAAGHGVAFSPDTLAQARTDGYDNCAKCIGGSLH